MPDRSPNDPRCRYEEIHKILAKILEMRLQPQFDYDGGLEALEKWIDIWYSKISICKRTTNKDRCQTAWVLYHNGVISGKYKIPEVCAHGNYQSFSKAQEAPLENPEELV